MTPEQEALRRDRGALMSALGVKFAGKVCRCPFHDDRKPSAGIYEDAGVWRFKCHGCGAGGDIFDVQKLKTGGSGLEREPKPTPTPEKPPKVYRSIAELEAAVAHRSETYRYTDPETGVADLVVLRVERPGEAKRFLQARPEGGGFVLKAPDGKLPLYNRTRLKHAAEVFVVEGEKCVHALHAAGYVATTSPGGALKGHMADWSPLAGKTCYLWPDNDAPDERHADGKGCEHMRQVRKMLEPLGCRLFWVEPSALGLPPKGDAHDYLTANGGTAEDLRIAVELVKGEARPLGAARELASRFEEMIAGRWKNIEWPWPRLTNSARALLPGTVTCVNGDAGASKSLLMLEALAHWHAAGVRSCVYELEEDRTYHLNRALAQLAGESGLTDPVWVRDNPDDAREHLALYADFLDSFGRTVWDAPDREADLKEVESWVIDRCSDGFEVVVVDPITAAKTSEKRWQDDNRFMFNVKTAARKTGARVVLVTHPKEGEGKGRNDTLGNMAGGAAYRRFSQSVLWLKRHDEKKRGDVMRDGYRAAVSYDRTLRITKARNGPGAGLQLAYTFDPRTLRFTEQGVVVSETRAASYSAEEDVKW